MKLDILAFGVHPDDVELSCSGAILKHIEQGYKVGIIDLTQGELGTRGSAELRLVEATNSAKILGVSIRENLGLADGFFANDKSHQLEIIKTIRKFQPEIVLANAIEDRHPDHARAAKLVSEACFLSGLMKITTVLDKKEQKAWRPKVVYNYIQDHYIKPDITIDITQHFDKKIESIMAFSSQFYNPNSKEPVTPISSEDFFEYVKSRARLFGRAINAKYAEGFTVERCPGVKSLFDLI